LTLAKDLAHAVKARLVLVGRSGLPSRSDWTSWSSLHPEQDPVVRKIADVLEIERMGGTVLIQTGDVCVQEDMARVRDATLSAFGRLDGIIHAAGLPGNGLIARKTTDEIGRVLNPKVFGAAVLASVFASDEMDFVAFCSSATAVTGRVGQVDYSAGNAFLDSFANSDAFSKSMVISIGWSRWRQVGMASDKDAAANVPRLKEQVNDSTIDSDAVADSGSTPRRGGIEPAAGADAFRRIIASCPSHHIIASDVEFRVLIQEAREMLGQTSEDPTHHPRSPGNIPGPVRRELAHTQLAAKLLSLCAQVTGAERISMDDDFFRIGGTSLGAIQLAALVRTTLGIRMPLGTVYEARTVAQMTRTLQALATR